jgi:hypothetical protein
MTEEQKPIEWKTEIGDDLQIGVYVDSYLTTYIPQHFILDFGRMIFEKSQFKVLNRIIVSPQVVKGLLKTLTTVIQEYEKRFGTIPELEIQQAKVKKTSGELSYIG